MPRRSRCFDVVIDKGAGVGAQKLARLSKEQLVLARRRLVRMHHRARVGHLGGNLSALDAMLVVHHHHLPDDACFILSKGHAAGALYVALWSIGKLGDDELDTFHADGTRLAGHPPSRGIPGVPFATGSLGHGLSLATGTALARRLRADTGRVFCLTSDGEWQEGSTWEALIQAHHWRLSNLTVLIDHNRLQGFGRTDDVASMSPLWERLKGFDLHLVVVNGHDIDAIDHALAHPAADRLNVVVLDTVKGHGLSFAQDQMAWHYLPLTDAQCQQALRELGTA
jgi:transketolase